MNVLIIGQGAREHALGWKIKQSRHLTKLYFAPGNSGTALLGENVKLDLKDIAQMADWALAHQIDLTIVGPEDPLLDGIQNVFGEKGLLLFGPSRQGALLEASKVWSKDFLRKYKIPTAYAQSFVSPKEAKNYIQHLEPPFVVKADGLAQGKGVVVCKKREEGEQAVQKFMVEKKLGQAGEKILIEEFLPGEEISVFALLDGQRFCYLGEARDYKRAHDGDEGPNTGGMGSISFSSLLDEKRREEIKEKILTPTLKGLVSEKIDYRGVLYAGIMLTYEGPKVLEFNVRFGDPETQVLLPRMQEDLLPLLLHAAKGNLTEKKVELRLEAFVAVVVAANGYPGTYEKGFPLPDLEKWPLEILRFHANTFLGDGKHLNEGGRTLTVVASGNSLEDARKKVYQAIESSSWDHYFYRKDIGAKLVPMKARNE